MSAQKKKTLIIVCAAVVLVAAMLAVWFAFGPKGTAGQKAVGVTVVYADATSCHGRCAFVGTLPFSNSL